MSNSIYFEGLYPDVKLDNSPTKELLSSFEKSRYASVSPVFVIGCPRSGTTLLANVLGANDELAVADESMFLLDSWNIFNRYVMGNNRRSSGNLATFTTPQQNLDHIAYYVNSVYSDLISSKQGAHTPVEHTPVYSYLYDFIELLFDDPTYIHIVREESLVVDSLRRVRQAGGLWGQENDEKRRHFRDFWVKNSRLIGQRTPDRYFEVTYADLVSKPEETLHTSLAHLGLKWTESMQDAMLVKYAQA